MKRTFYILVLFFILTSCGIRTIEFKNSPKLENIADTDTLFIVACIHYHCGGEWGGCLEYNKVYRQENNYSVKFTNGMTVWGGDTIIDPNKIKSLTKVLSKSDEKAVNDFLHEVSIFSDSTSVTSNGPNYYVIKTSDYKKTIIKDYDKWLFYQKLKDSIYK